MKLHEIVQCIANELLTHQRNNPFMDIKITVVDETCITIIIIKEIGVKRSRFGIGIDVRELQKRSYDEQFIHDMINEHMLNILRIGGIK